MKLPFFKKKEKELPEGMTRQQIIPRGVDPRVRSKEEIYNQARMKTDHDAPPPEFSDAVRAFLQQHGHFYADIDYNQVTDGILSAMEKGLRGEDGGLPMLPSFLSDQGEIPEDEPVAVLDIGGSHLRAAVVTWTHGAYDIEQREVLPLPGMTRSVKWETFIKKCADLLEPRVQDTDRIGVCFCYAAEPTPECDVRVHGFTKEVKITGSEVRLLCADLMAELAKRGVTGKHFTALNDTVAAQLTGIAVVPPRYGGDFAGMVLGTGVNTCLPLPVSRVEKLGRPDDDSRILVNVECGFYNGVKLSDFDRVIDAASDAPGACLFEKQISGKYLGEQCRLALVGAAREGLFSPAVAEKLLAMEHLDTSVADAFELEPEYSDALPALAGASEADRETAGQLIRACFLRAANLATCAVSALSEMIGRPKDRYKPIITCVDGSLFNNSFRMHTAMTLQMQDFTNEERECYALCKGVEKATYIGSAVAAWFHE